MALLSGFTKRFIITPTSVNPDLYYDLSRAPAAFWANVRSDGGDIRVTKQDGTTEVPREVSGFDYAGHKGTLVVGTSGGTAFYVYYGNAALTEPSVTATYGRNAVRSGCQAAFLFDEVGGNIAYDRSGNNRNVTFRGLTYSGAAASLLSDANGKFLRMAGPIQAISQLTGTTDLPFGKVTTYQKIARKWVCPANFSLLKAIGVKRSAGMEAVAGTAYCELRTDNAGSPSETVVTSRSLTTGSNGTWPALPTGSDARIYFDTALVAGTTYWIVYRMAANSDTNFPAIKYDPANGTGNIKVFDGVNWNAANGDFRFFVSTCDEGSMASNVALTYNSFGILMRFRRTSTKYECAVSNARGDGSGMIELNEALNRFRFETRANNVNEYRVETGVNFNDGNWHTLRMVSSATECRLYIDGVSRGSRAALTDTNTQNFKYIGTPQSSPYMYSDGYTGDIGLLEFGPEVTSTQAATEHANLSNQAAFWTTGAAESYNTCDDAFSVGDTLLKRLSGRALLDSIAVQDTIGRQIGRILQDTLDATDSIVRQFTMRLGDALGLDDSQLKAISGRSFDDGLVVGDSISRSIGRLLVDGLACTDVLGRGIGRLLTDAMKWSDSLTHGILREFKRLIVKLVRPVTVIARILTKKRVVVKVPKKNITIKIKDL